MKRIEQHPILGDNPTDRSPVTIYFDGEPYAAFAGDMIAAALMANGVSTLRYTK